MIVVVACLKIGLEFALNLILCVSFSNLANSLLSVMVVNTFQRRMVSMPTATMTPTSPDNNTLSVRSVCIVHAYAYQ